MAPRGLFPWMGLRERVLLLLYYEGPKEVRALALELAERPRTLRYLLERVIPALEREGALVVEDGVARLAVASPTKAPAPSPAPKAKGGKGKEPNPVQALAEANPHVRGLLLQVGKRLPKKGKQTLFLSEWEFYERARLEGQDPEVPRLLDQVDILVLDDLGKAWLTPFAAEVLFGLVEAAHRKDLPVP